MCKKVQIKNSSTTGAKKIWTVVDEAASTAPAWAKKHVVRTFSARGRVAAKRINGKPGGKEKSK